MVFSWQLIKYIMLLEAKLFATIRATVGRLLVVMWGIGKLDSVIYMIKDMMKIVFG